MDTKLLYVIQHHQGSTKIYYLVSGIILSHSFLSPTSIWYFRQGWVVESGWNSFEVCKNINMAEILTFVDTLHIYSLRIKKKMLGCHTGSNAGPLS